MCGFGKIPRIPLAVQSQFQGEEVNKTNESCRQYCIAMQGMQADEMAGKPICERIKLSRARLLSLRKNCCEGTRKRHPDLNGTLRMSAAMGKTEKRLIFMGKER